MTPGQKRLFRAKLRNINGTIMGYEFYVSDDGTSWGNPVASGSWPRNNTEKEVVFDSVSGSFIRLVATSEVNGNSWTSVAELKLLVTVAGTDDEEPDGEGGARTYTLYPNFPNPFNSVTTIRFNLNRDANVAIRICDVSGKHIKTLLSESKAVGDYSLTWDGRNESGIRVGSGIYIYQFRANDYSQNRKMLLIK